MNSRRWWHGGLLHALVQHRLHIFRRPVAECAGRAALDCGKVDELDCAAILALMPIAAVDKDHDRDMALEAKGGEPLLTGRAFGVDLAQLQLAALGRQPFA